MEIYRNDICYACYFRTIADPPNKKIIIQLTERCNLNCVHCFVNAGTGGSEMGFVQLRDILLPKLKAEKFTKVTFTGGEPFCYSNLPGAVDLFTKNGIEVAICTNGTLVSQNFLDSFATVKNIHFNVSLDAFTNDSYASFRRPRDKNEFTKVVETIKTIGKSGKLKGLCGWTG